MSKYGGFGGGNMNMQQMMKQAQKMQEQMALAQAELEEMEIEGTSGGDMVTVVMNGKKKMLSVKIKPEACDPDDIEMLEDLILAAYNEALELAEAESEKIMPISI